MSFYPSVLICEVGIKFLLQGILHSAVFNPQMLIGRLLCAEDNSGE